MSLKLLLLLTGLCLSLHLSANAATLNVPAQYATIQSAVNAAANGDTVLVAAGTYSGDGNRDIDFGGKSLTVTSSAGAASTIIDCGGQNTGNVSGNHRGFYLHRGETNAVISGFTVKNGYEYDDGTGDDGNGGGICIDNSSVSIQNCTITASIAQSGCGIYNINENGGTIALTNCTIMGNTEQVGVNDVSSISAGGGVYSFIGNSSTITLTNCIITGNTAQDGGGVCNQIDDIGTIALTNCTIMGNTATNGEGGGGVYNENDSFNYYAGTITLTNCTISGNTEQGSGNSVNVVGGSYRGGGVYNINLNGGTTALINCSITSNTATTGGGVYNFNQSDNSSAITLTNCTITKNAAQDSGGIYNYDVNEQYNSGTITLTNNIIYGDTNGEIVNDNSNGPNAVVNAVANYCDIQEAYLGTSNIRADPLFVNSANGDYHLNLALHATAQAHTLAHRLPIRTALYAPIRPASEPTKAAEE